MAISIVIDTNIALYHLRDELPTELEGYSLFTSVICEIELLSFPRIDETEEDAIKKFLSFVTVVDITSGVKHEAIAIRRRYGTKLPDAIVCATAKVLECPLLTADTRLERIDCIRIRKVSPSTTKE